MRSSFADIVGGVWCIGAKPNAFLARDHDGRKEIPTSFKLQTSSLQHRLCYSDVFAVSAHPLLLWLSFFFYCEVTEEWRYNLSVMLFRKYDSEPLVKKTLRVSLLQKQRAVYWAEQVKWLWVSSDSFNKHVQHNEARTSWWSEIKSGVDVGD